MEDGKSASSTRREIEREKKLKEIKLDQEILNLHKKMYWEEFRFNLRKSVNENIYFGLGISTASSVVLRSVVIFPISMLAFTSYHIGKTWIITPRVD